MSQHKHVVTVFVLSHNLQVQDSQVPAIDAKTLADGLKQHCVAIQCAEPLDHPHWMVRLEADLDPEALARQLTAGWQTFRQASGHSCNHVVMALGGRKDSMASPGSPLQQGAWGVDVVETADPEPFLMGINWDGLVAGRPADGGFKVLHG